MRRTVFKNISYQLYRRSILDSFCNFVVLLSILFFSAYCIYSQKTKPTPKPVPQQSDGLTPVSRQSVEKAIAFLNQENFAEAEKEARNAVKLSPRSPVAHNLLGVIFDQQGKATEALAELNTAIKLAPDFVSAKNNLGKLLATQGKLKEAHKVQDIAAIDAATAEMNAAWTAASEEMYKATQDGAPGADQPHADAGQEQGGNQESKVEDVPFEEVK